MKTHCLAALAALAACTSPAPGDDRDATFLASGKADGGISDGSPEAIGVLAVANQLTQPQLDNDVGLDARAARYMIEHRDGADQIAGTADDDPFGSLEELDAVWYVGPVAFGKLLAYARAHGFVPANTGWHFENPTPDATTRSSVFALAPDDVWVAGLAGFAEHWDGTAWHTLATGVTTGFASVWASGPNDVWFVGEQGAIVRYNGSAFTTLDAHTTRNLYSVHGTGPNDVWIVGDNDSEALYGLILHWNGSAFTVAHAGDCPNTLYSVYASSPTDVWVGGAVRTICHFDGTSWTGNQVADQNQDDVSALWPDGTGALWAAYGGNMWRYDGAKWAFSYALPDDPNSYLVPSLWRVTGRSATDVYATGSHGYVAHWDGASWTPTRIPGNADYAGIAITGTASGWAVGDAARAALDGSGWHETYHVVTRQWLWSASGTSASDVWALGSMGDLVHRTANGWSAVSIAPLTGNDFPESVTAVGANDVWIAASYNTAHWDGHTWTPHPELSDVRSIWAAAPTDLWAVTEGGHIWHGNGSTWTAAASPTGADLFHVAGTGPSDAWAAGAGTILHYDGTSWTKVNEATDQTSWSHVLALAPDDVWVSGESQSVRHWNGTAWQTIAATTTDRPWLRDGYAVAPDSIYFVESGNALLHWDGTQMTREPLAGVSTVLGFGADLFTTGETGWIRHR